MAIKKEKLCSLPRCEKAYSTWYSQAVSHPSTNQARPCLASEIGRDRACSGWYGRKREQCGQMHHLYMPIIALCYVWKYYIFKSCEQEALVTEVQLYNTLRFSKQ